MGLDRCFRFGCTICHLPLKILFQRENVFSSLSFLLIA